MGSISQDFPKPPGGLRTALAIVDKTAAVDPSKTFIYNPRSDDPRDGWDPITFQQIANGVNYIAHEVESMSDKHAPPGSLPTVAYIGPSDVRYVMFMLGCIKARHQALFISPRNTQEAQLSLFQATSCNLLWYTEPFHKAVQSWTSQRPMQTLIAPSISTWLNSTAAPFPYNRLYDDALLDPMVVLHTSGSTGIPKPIVVRQVSLALADKFRELPDFHGKRYTFSMFGDQATKVLIAMPSFHAAGVMSTTIFCIYMQTPVVSMPARPVEAGFISDCLTLSGCDAALLPPSIVEDMLSSEEQIQVLEKLNYVGFGGGNLPQTAGNNLKGRVKLANIIGSTEHFPYPMYYHAEPEIWNYFLFNSDAMGARWDVVDEDEGIYELVIVRKGLTGGNDQAIFYTFPHLNEWSTRDMFKAHPTKPDYWAYHGRTDNIIVFSNGEKLNPVTMEDIISGHRDIKGAIVVGQDRFQSALVVEPRNPVKDGAEAEALIEKIWPVIEKANQETSTHARLGRNLIAVAEPDRPFARAGKGTVQRALTAKLYQDVIDAMYERAEDPNGYEAAQLDLASEEALTQSILDLIATKTEGHDLGPDADFFSAGIDSLQVIRISDSLRAGFKAAGIPFDKDSIAPKVVYAHPTARCLAAKLFRASRSQNGTSTNGEIDNIVEDMKKLLAKYTADLPAPKQNKPDPLNQGQTILVTGTTGSLGAYLLDKLCSLPQVKRIVALNRGDDGGASRQPSINSDRGLSADFSKVEFLCADLSQPDMGLGAKYNELLTAADRIIHNAWPVNFNITIASFEPYIGGVRNLAVFSNAASKNVPIVFVSSVGTVHNWQSQDTVPEERLEDMTLAGAGYGQSKLLGSLILDAAAEHSGVPAASIRVGQIAGPRSREGVWNPQEFVPSLIASSVYMGVLPTHLAVNQLADWTPVEDIAGLVLDIAGITVEVPLSDISGYFHGVNPAKATWEQVAATLLQYYGDRIKQTASLAEWVGALEKSAATTTDVDKNPGIKLLDTYRGLATTEQAGFGQVVFDMERTKRHSPTMRSVTAVTPELVKNWCDQWQF